MENLQTDLSTTVETKLYYDLFVPENAAKPLPLLLTTHGYGASKKYMMREARNVANNGFVVASLQGLHQFWREQSLTAPKLGFSWLTNFKPEESVAIHHKFLLDVIRKLAHDEIIDESNVFLMGFSQTCALSFRFAFTNPNVLRGVIGICGGIPSDWETSELYQATNTSVSYLYANNDEFYPLEKLDKNAERLKSRAANLTAKSYDATHEITDEMRVDIQVWLQNNLGK